MATHPSQLPPPTRLSHPEAFRQCVARIMSCSIHETPVVPTTTRGEWNFIWRQWLAEQGWVIRKHIVGGEPIGVPLIATMELMGSITAVVCSRQSLCSDAGTVRYYQSLCRSSESVGDVCIHGYLSECDICLAPKVSDDNKPMSRWRNLTRYIFESWYRMLRLISFTKVL